MNNRTTVACLKIGMTRMFRNNGQMLCGSVLAVPKEVVVRAWGRDGKQRAQLMFSANDTKPKLSKAQVSHFLKCNCHPGLHSREVEFSGPFSLNPSAFNLSAKLEVGMKVNIRGTSIGKGFSGVIKRHGFSSGRASHGTSKAHNKPGSTGMTQDPGRVFKGKKMAGRMGSETVTVRNLEVLYVAKDKDLILVKGAVPGYAGCRLIISCPNACPNHIS